MRLREVGCEGDSIDTTRVPFPWDHLGVGDAADTIVLPGTPGAYVVSCARR